MVKSPTDEKSTPILELEGVEFSPPGVRGPFTGVLSGGDLAFLRRRTGFLEILGMREIRAGKIRVFGKSWDEKTEAEVEVDRQKVGTVVNPLSKYSANWVSNLNVDENVMLAADFDRRRSERSVEGKAAELANLFGIDGGLPKCRSSLASPEDLIRAQWVRAFLPEPLRFLILENPLFSAPPDSAELLAQSVRKAMDEKVAVLWISEISPDFSKLGITPDFLLE